MNLVSREKAIDVAIDEYNRGYKEGFEAGKASVSGGSDLISQKAAVDALERIFDRCEEIEAHLPEGDPDRVGYKMYPDWLTVWKYLHQLPSAQPDLDEWCTDCSEYDQERHCCPRWNRVIRQTLKDAQPERKKGKWISELRPHKTEDEEIEYWYTYCSVCGCHRRIGWFDAKFCPNCGADMRGDTNELCNDVPKHC